ncbi:MAG TPA: prepilin-type N-terminal cleavage/methylation domain-containing protein [Solirubrobacterales bacterium]|nr:prepilin-type N-terminal cleavage/methylation domain-containing protein [Solirubrobacterales bacterium]
MTIARFNRWLRLAHEEDGLTLIEVLVAAIILALAAMATFGVLAAATRNAQRAQATQVALDKAQEEMEKLQTLSYSELALTKAPQYVNNPLNPNYRYRVSDGKFAVQRDPLGQYGEIVRNEGSLYGSEDPIEGGVVKPGPFPFEEGNVSGDVYRYIVWRNDPQCPESEVGSEDFCPGQQDYKQLIVAVKLDGPVAQQGETNYVEVQSKVSNPLAQAQRSTRGDNVGEGGTGEETEQEKEEREKEEEENESAGTGKAITAQQFFLSDTPCSASGETTRADIESDHLLHNTLGTCASGLRNGQTKNGAPDALLLGSPPDPDPVDETNPLLYDYSSDSYLEPTPDTDKGTQILHDDSAGCNYVPKSSVHPEAKVHRWVTDPMPREFKMSGTVTLEFYSRTLNEASYPGTVCAYLFIRSETGTGESTVATDTLLENKEVAGRLYWTYSSQGTGSWPRTEWTKLRLKMNIAGVSAESPKIIATGQRLGVALSVDAGTTPADAIPVMYDHPNYPTRLEVDTTTPFEGN